MHRKGWMVCIHTGSLWKLRVRDGVRPLPIGSLNGPQGSGNSSALSLPQTVPSYCENKPELGQPENGRPHGDDVTSSRLFVMA